MSSTSGTLVHPKKVSFLKTCINGINALSGIGILSVPYALSSGGWASLVLLFVIAAAAFFTGLLIRRCMDSDPRIATYPDIAGRAFGPKGRVVASVFLCLELYLVATGLLILEGDNLHKLSPDFALNLGHLRITGRHSFVILSGLVILPTMLFNDLGLLSYVSFGGVLSSLVVVACVLSIGLSKGIGFHEKGRLLDLNGMPTALSLYTFCYGAHAVFPPIYSSMRKKTQFPKVLFLSFVVCTIIYFSMAILGYLMYGQNVQSQVTLNLPMDKVGTKVAIYTILAGPVAKYALTVMPIATVIIDRIPPSYQDSNVAAILVRMALLISTVVMAILFPSFQSVASLTGSLLIACVSFLLPCICYLKIFGVSRDSVLELVGVVGIILIAGSVGVMGTYSSISQTIRYK